jgi:hypothetical protein
MEGITQAKIKIKLSVLSLDTFFYFLSELNGVPSLLKILTELSNDRTGAPKLKFAEDNPESSLALKFCN